MATRLPKILLNLSLILLIPLHANAVSEGEEKVINDIAETFADVVGTEEDAAEVVEGLVDGSITYVPPQIDTNGDGVIDELDDPVEPITVDGRQMGYGNAFTTLAITSQLVEELGFDDALNEVLRLRIEEDMGWGEIAQELGFKLGHVVSEYRAGKIRPNIDSELDDISENGDIEVSGLPERAANANKSNRPEKIEKAAKSNKPEKIERVAKIERPERPERVAKIERPERPERPEKPNKPEKVERFEKPQKPERANR